MTRSNRTATISFRSSLRASLRASFRASVLLTALVGALGCAAQDRDPGLHEVATGTATSEIKVAVGTKVVVPKGLSTLSAGFLVVSTVSSDPVTGGEQGKACPFEGAKETKSGDTACGYDINQQWVCCDGTCDYTCHINQDSNRQYWNTDSCTVVQSTCSARAGGPGGGGFDIFEIQGAGG